MTLTINLPDHLNAALQNQARAAGLSEAALASKIVVQTISNQGLSPLETSYGMWAQYGSAPSAEEIDENRRDMFRNFAKDF